ncbi:hypothetical protein [Brevundimonas viscosa]|uniref:Uncharacterized protein n=1 Tax=Brevundimonas viscosa TaxID=871741 RepID=A0A1I6PQQ7_9CAUL|nr:hypothetical protein [Brevundimonas viscosa]SFS42562.1 hypothetical protein SAMN05192570_1194 [Brevundimonas viscosa]
MSRQESLIIGRIDRRRERADAREERTARQKALQARADSLILSEIGTLPANDHADFSECLAASIRANLVRLHGEPSAASILSREAYEAGKNILPRKVMLAEAARLFAKPANDGGDDV